MNQATQWLGINRWAISRSIQHLQKTGLLDAQWKPQEPQGQFRTRRLGKQEPDTPFNRLAYTTICFPAPDSGLSVAETALYSMILSEPDRHFSYQYFEQALNKRHTNVKRALSTLQEKGLLKVITDPMGFYAQASDPAEFLHLFRQQDPKPQQETETQSRTSTADPYKLTRLLNAGVPSDLAEQIADAAQTMTWQHFDRMLQESTEQNRTCPHPGKLMAYKVREWTMGQQMKKPLLQQAMQLAEQPEPEHKLTLVPVDNVTKGDTMEHTEHAPDWGNTFYVLRQEKQWQAELGKAFNDDGRLIYGTLQRRFQNTSLYHFGDFEHNYQKLELLVNALLEIPNMTWQDALTHLLRKVAA